MDTKTHLKKIRDLYEDQLINSVLPFWLNNGMDNMNGGIYTSLDRDGSIIDTNKSVWFQGRALWVFSKAYEKYIKAEYLEASKSLVHFLEDHCFDEDGRMFFRVTQDGKPVIKRIRYFFSETFAIIGFTQYAKITGDKKYIEKALSLFEFVEKLRTTPSLLIPKYNQETSASKSFAEPMILLNVLSELRQVCPEKEEWINSYIDKLIAEIQQYFVRTDMKLVLEQCALDGAFQSEHFEGRLLNPGHSIEGAWFIMAEGIARDRQDYKNLGIKMLSWMWDIGWDDEFEGIIQYRDALGKDLSEYHQDMKFWWPQCEASIAQLMAYEISKNEDNLNKFYLVNDYIQNRFVDNLYGEWYGYFHKDGSIATCIKGNFYKGPFHIPRMYYSCIDLIDIIIECKE